MDDQQIKNIYLNCNRVGVRMEDLLKLVLDDNSGITIEGLRAAGYNKLPLLEQRYYREKEDIEWAKCQNSITDLAHFIDKNKAGLFSGKYLAEAQKRMKELSAAKEHEAWNSIRFTDRLSEVLDFIDSIENGVYSDTYRNEALRLAENLDWMNVRNSSSAQEVDRFLALIQRGRYSTARQADALDLRKSLENKVVFDEWEKIQVSASDTERRSRLEDFVYRYANSTNPDIAELVEKAQNDIKRLEDAEEARRDWLDASEVDTVSIYLDFIKAHPYSEYREEAQERIDSKKGELLQRMRTEPFSFSREDMHELISSKVFSVKELVDETDILTDRAYNHIKKYPTLISEQRPLPVSEYENPVSQPGNTDIIFFGVPGSGKTCVLAGLLSLSGRHGFSFDPKGPGGGGSYALDLRNYARQSMLPPATDQAHIQIIDAEIVDDRNVTHPVSFIEMSGEHTAQFASLGATDSLDYLGPGAAGVLSSGNPKMIFFVIDPVNEKEIRLKNGTQQLHLMQSDVLACVCSLLEKNPKMMKNVSGIQIILTKSDTLGDYVDGDVIRNVLESQDYGQVLRSLERLRQKYNVNRQTGFEIGIYPFSVGDFMPGDVYTFNNRDSLTILRVIQQNTTGIREKSWKDRLTTWFNS